MILSRSAGATLCCTALCCWAGVSGALAAPHNGAGGASADAPATAPASTPGVPQGGGDSDDSPQAIAHSASTLATQRLRPGSRGRYVRTLQRLLTKTGLAVQLSGSFDRRTSHALRRFQKAHGLPVSGRLSRATAEQLGAAASAAVSARRSAPAPPAAGNAGWVFPLAPIKTVESPRYWSLDQGVDLGGVSGQCGPQLEELAVASGTIVQLGVEGFGKSAPVLKLDSGPDAGRFVYYGHAEPALVTVGEHVLAGQPVAEVGCGIVGISSTPHLEIGISEVGSHVPCCPSRGATSGETLNQLTLAYRYAQTHPQTPVGPPAVAQAPPGSSHNGGAAATP